MLPIASPQCDDLVFIEETMGKASYQRPVEVMMEREIRREAVLGTTYLNFSIEIFPFFSVSTSANAVLTILMWEEAGPLSLARMRETLAWGN